MSEDRDIAAIIAGARLPRRTVPLCLRGDLQAAFEDVTRRLDAPRPAGSDSLAGDPDARALAEQVEMLREQMRAAIVVFTLQALPRLAWAEFTAGHPPRDDHPDDKVVGFNQDTFYDALIRECCIDPQLDSDQWAHLFDNLTSRQFDDLAAAAWALNRRDVEVPTSRAASAILSSAT